jgi:hypothetical protein
LVSGKRTARLQLKYFFIFFTGKISFIFYFLQEDFKMTYSLKDNKNNPVKHEGKSLRGADYSGVVKNIDSDQRTITLIASDNSRDRDGDIISVKGWEFDNYLKNPIMLWAHDYSSVPLARCIKIQRTNSQLILTHQFPKVGINCNDQASIFHLSN